MKWNMKHLLPRNLFVFCFSFLQSDGCLQVMCSNNGENFIDCCGSTLITSPNYKKLPIKFGMHANWFFGSRSSRIWAFFVFLCAFTQHQGTWVLFWGFWAGFWTAGLQALLVLIFTILHEWTTGERPKFGVFFLWPSETIAPFDALQFDKQGKKLPEVRETPGPVCCISCEATAGARWSPGVRMTVSSVASFSLTCSTVWRFWSRRSVFSKPKRTIRELWGFS